MQKLKVSLENCYGIKKLDKEFDFSSSKVNAIYAKNGSMKTSLTKTFKKLQENKSTEIGDEIFGALPVKCEVKVDGNDIRKEDIFVIHSFESSYESDSLASLLVNDELKLELNKVIKLKDKFLSLLEKKSGKKIMKTVGGKKVYDLEPSIIEDFNFEEKSFLLNLNKIEAQNISTDFSNISYASIFDDSVLKKIRSEEFQTKIDEYINKCDEIYATYSFLDKGKFTLPKIKDIQKSFEKNTYFVKGNKIVLDGNSEITNIIDLDNKIKEVENKVTSSNEFKEIEKLLSDAKGTILKDIIETFPEVIEELKLENLEEFRVKLWLSYINSELDKFNELKSSYNDLEEAIEQADLDETPWQEALDIFNKRFSVPFHMEISNLKSSIIGEGIPKVLFGFCKDGDLSNQDPSNWVKLDRENVENKNILSQGEKRALYLLNIIFDIEKRRRENRKTLFIVDDIADSFDYKNKYAIIEYLIDMADKDDFYMLLLSHNFDFYRTVSSRLGLQRDYRHDVNKSENGIEIKKELYQDKPFIYWKERLEKKHIIALIPFVRNLIEYGVDKRINSFSGIDDDYLLLTNIIHLKDHTANIKIYHLKEVYREYMGNDRFRDINDNDDVYPTIDTLASTMTNNDTKLEDKIIMSIAIRLKAEEYMKNVINNSNANYTWTLRRQVQSGDKNALMSFISSVGNQTRELFNAYRQVGEQNHIKILDRVNIMTPESIHLNSFMYEPILDMDIIELKQLYDDTCNL